jgi:hypothetical protein
VLEPADLWTARLPKRLADRAQFRWRNHTYAQTYLEYFQNFSTVP